jgi:thiol-disulfide isomerase/thioredoxin
MVNLDERTFKGTPMADAYNDFHMHFYGYNMQRNKERKTLTAIKETISPAEFNERWSQIDDKYRNLQGELTDSLVRLNKDNLLGAIALDDLALVDTTRFMQLYGMMSQEMQSFYMLKNDVKNIALQSRTAPGKMFTDYLIKEGNLDGSDVSLSDYVGKGKYILLDHWASWCGPCKAEMPYIKKVWENFAGEHFDVVSIAVNDKRENTLRALKSLDMPWHQIIDAQRIPLSSYNISAIPHLILFAPDGTILKRGLRGEQIYTTIQQILSDKAL